MRVDHYILSFVVLNALSVCAGAADKLSMDPVEMTPFAVKIWTPVDTDYYIKTLSVNWTIDSHDRASFSDEKRGIPNHKKAKYEVTAQIDWPEPFTDLSVVQKRAFWVGRGDPNVFPARDLLKCTISLRNWPAKDIWVFLGRDWSYIWRDKCDSVQGGWLKCLGKGDGAGDWNDLYFVVPELPDVGSPKCSK